jgi:hypothetical protein
MFEWLLPKKILHRCTPMVYTETGEKIVFHWDVPWSFSQTFHVCEECEKVTVLTETTADNRSPLGGYRKEKNKTLWSGYCDYAKVPSIGRDKLHISRKNNG